MRVSREMHTWGSGSRQWIKEELWKDFTTLFESQSLLHNSVKREIPSTTHKLKIAQILNKLLEWDLIPRGSNWNIKYTVWKGQRSYGYEKVTRKSQKFLEIATVEEEYVPEKISDYSLSHSSKIKLSYRW